MPIRTKHLFIDATVVGTRVTGIERYASEITRALIAKDVSVGYEVTILVARNSSWWRDRLFRSVSVRRSVFDSRLLTEQVWIPRVLLGAAPSVCFFPAFPPSPLVFHLARNTRIVRTVYDAVMWRHPETLPWKNKLYMRPLETYGISRYHFIATISKSAESELCEFFPDAASKIENCGIGLDPAKFSVAHENCAVIRSKYHLPESFILSVGTLEPRKNLLFLLEVVDQIRKRHCEVCIVLAGRFGWGTEALRAKVHALSLEDNVRVIGAVSDDDIAQLYRMAAVLAFPSLYEGFGLPIIEAMASGTPVVASNTSSMPEAAGTAATLLPPDDTRAWADALSEIIRDSNRATEMSQAGLRQAQRFRWDSVAENIVRHL